MNRWILGGASLLWMVFVSIAQAAPCPEYEDDFRQAARRYFSDRPAVRWQFLAAQVFAESSCRTRARSSVGAEGIAQFMPATWREVVEQVPQLRTGTPYDPSLAIVAQAYYLRRQYDFCDRRIAHALPQQTRLFAAASYNAGAGNICIKAYRLSGSPYWVDNAQVLAQVTGHHAQETIGYIERIEKLYAKALTRTDRAYEKVLESEVVPSAVVLAGLPPTAIVATVASEAASQVLPGSSFLWKSILLNYQFAFLPAMLGILVLWVAYKIFDKLTPTLDTAEELRRGNIAVAYWICTILLMIGSILSISIYTGMKG